MTEQNQPEKELSLKSSQLKYLPIFKALPEESLSRLIKNSRELYFEAGREISTSDGRVLVVLEGEVSCFIHDAADKKFLLSTVSVGEVLGELSSLVPAGAAHEQQVFLQSLTDVRVLAMSNDLFFEQVESCNQVANVLLRILAIRLASMNRFAKSVVDVDIDAMELRASTFGEKVADWMSAKIGSWQFLFGSFAFVALWTALNGYVLSAGWDPYPFIFLNLVFSVVSAATLPVLLMSQNRQTQMDRLAARVSHRMTLRATQLNSRILREIRGLRRRIDAQVKRE